ncbi:cytochrome P450 [Podospora appendiculata]|uniref:Cytochrome P450 n=1 Tax=Podospora appendiculata TaxID=314037 RepID=A0AAE0X4C5_9PEZI|nr:cytochrome P450 [Podospora appendiculata]
MAFFTLPSFWILSLVASISYLGYIAIYRRYFHPLSHIPGPFLWASEKDSSSTYSRISTLFTASPVVRIAPDQVHLNDPANYEKVYNVGSKYTKDPAFYGALEGSVKIPIILTVKSNEEHRVRRGALNPFFSRRSVLDLEQIIWSKTRKLCGMMRSSLDADGVFDIHHAIRAFSVDIITEYAYARCWNQMDMSDFGADYQEAIRGVQMFLPFFHLLPSLGDVFALVPDWLIVRVFPKFQMWLDSNDLIRKAVTEVRREISQGIKPARRTIFHELIDTPVTNPAEPDADGRKHHQTLSDEFVFADAINVTGAGAETTGSTANRAIFEVLSSPSILRTLQAELAQAFPDAEAMSLTALEKLPYLTGVIKEALRLNPGLPGHLPRVVPAPGAAFNGIALPPGTVVSMSAWLMHHDRAAFPDPEIFDPTRWIHADDDEHAAAKIIRARERCLVPFGRGSRNCLGQNLAMCELYATVAGVFRCFDDIEVHPGFGREDLRMVELLLGYHPRKARRFRVVRKGGVSQPTMAGHDLKVAHRRISDEMLRTIYASDQEMYPAPLSFDRLRSWVDACPDLCICFETQGSTEESGSSDTPTPVGVVIVLPLLQAHWEDVLVGKVKEIEIDPATMFPNGTAKDHEEVVGLHVFHIERFLAFRDLSPTRPFVEFALHEVARRVAGMMTTWRVAGFSALTATPAGKRAFEREGFTATGYRETFTEESVDDVGDGAETVALKEVAMSCVYDGENTSQPLTHLDMVENDSRKVIATSEMAVKYCTAA